eukprot:365058-Chlamydomonas_euryale.AAC.3
MASQLVHALCKSTLFKGLSVGNRARSKNGPLSLCHTSGRVRTLGSMSGRGRRTALKVVAAVATAPKSDC